MRFETIIIGISLVMSNASKKTYKGLMERERITKKKRENI